ncbi:Dyp-type peroxidase [Actinomycetospora cinnamomea]|uniref:Deferrochelatase/peroxidase EfeB n=1 Tax=Actinomycetospora cinnamomea TaxID=663609 RepID=A0A2U1EWF3_9PSEU|nr:Dyp-type peroxidase [Actinomycetospora cinnamomea]PVZ04241.1 deferrochelatase/peroxidase EfeB [Actinomycetospora cinnamomea]
MTSGDRGGLSRRRLFTTGAALGGGALLAGCASSSSGSAPGGGPADRVPFHGHTQTGITSLPVPASGLLASFTSLAPDRGALEEMLRELTDEIDGLMSGRPPRVRDPALPPEDSGLLGAEPPPDDLSIVVGVGASLFDHRYGLAALRPRELVTMPFLANDRLDPARSHGDVLVSVQARHPDTVVFALRQLMRRTRRTLTLRWVLDGFGRGSAPGESTTGSPRNLLGFIDGTANLTSSNAALMDRYVWVAAGDPEPAWTAGGSYLVVRVIRMFVEFWDRTPLAEQEALIGRHKLSGAPLGRASEIDEPDYRADPDGRITPLDAHIRLANPRTPETAGSLLLRRGFSYTRGFDGAGALDQGLAFVCYQRSLEAGFLAVQGRLDGEPLEEYVMAEGGGFFFALPGVRGPGDFLGQDLLRT